MDVSTNRHAVGVIPARFQTPDLHAGHRFLISQVCDRHDDVLIVLGVSPARLNDKNMFPFEMRKCMIEQAFPQHRLTIVSSSASPADDAARSRSFDEQVQALFPGRDMVMYGSRKSFIHRYSGKHPVQEIETVFPGSATEIRNSIEVRNTSDFRHGYGRAIMDIGAHAYQAVDVVVWRKDIRDVILVGHKDEKLWRFPGVLYDLRVDVDFESAALRCIKKELPGVVTHVPRPERSTRIPDWRYSGTRDKILTMILSARFAGQGSFELRPGDGVARARWFHVSHVQPEILAPDHRPIAMIMAKKYGW